MAKSFDQVLAETGRQNLLDEIRSRPGGIEQAISIFNATGSVDQAINNVLGGGGGNVPIGNQEIANNPVDAIMNQVQQVIDEQLKISGQASQFLKDNPFAIDEELARKSAEERLDPFFQAELDDFTEGINLQRQRSEEDESRLQQELTTSTDTLIGRSRRRFQQALQASKEGFAGAGLFLSGRRERAEGTAAVEQQESEQDLARRKGLGIEESKTRQTRLKQDIGLRERTFGRQQKAARETAVQTDVARQATEQAENRRLELAQIIGEQ